MSEYNQCGIWNNGDTKMDNLVTNIRTFLLESSAIETVFAHRIYVVKAEDTTTYPFAILRTVTDQPAYTQDGEALREAVIQIDTYHDELVDAVTNAALIRARLTGYRGKVGTIEIGNVFVSDWREDWAPDARHFRVLNRFTINWTVT